MLINSAGEQEELTCFDRDDHVQAAFACSINWQNELFIFGGSNKGHNEQRKISRLSGHKLEHVGDLSFDHYNGACSVMANKTIFLCFGLSNSDTDSKLCRHSTGPFEKFSEVTLSTHLHRGIQTSCSDSKSLLFFFSDSLPLL